LDIIEDGFRDIEFHKRHMFVRGGVEDDLGASFIEDISQSLEISDVGDERRYFDFGMSRTQVRVDLVNAVLIFINQNELFWRKKSQLSAEFGPDGTPGAGDQDSFLLVLDYYLRKMSDETDEPSPEQVDDIDFPYFADPDLVVQYFEQPRDDFGFELNICADFDDPLDIL
jgi:hypothetical protein